MAFPDALYDAHTLAVLSQAFDAAWHEVQAAASSAVSEADLNEAKRLIILRLIVAANQGERDLEHLKDAAITAVKGMATGTAR